MWSTTATLAHATQAKQSPNAHQIGRGTSTVTMTFGVVTPSKLRILDTGRNA